MLATEDLTLHYGSSKILRGISIQASLGKITCIMGSNGVGKTSLLRVLSGTHPSSGGRYLLDGSDSAAYAPNASHTSACHHLHQLLSEQLLADVLGLCWNR